MKLFYSPGACSLSPHIALREAGLPFELEQVNLSEKKTKNNVDYLSVNPKGYVPALLLDDGRLLTEGAVIVQYVADQRPGARLAPPPASFERYRLQEWLNLIGTELHKGLGPINNPKSNSEIKEFYRDRVSARFQVVAKAVATKGYLLGEEYSVADGYLYYTLRGWRKIVGADFGDSAPLRAYFERIGARDAVKAALAAEGLA
jgi:glutathione S-transferase